MENQTKNVGVVLGKVAEDKKSITLPVTFQRKVFEDDDGVKRVYVQATTEYDEEGFRFKLADKDSRLFAYLLRIHGILVTDFEDNIVMGVK